MLATEQLIRSLPAPVSLGPRHNPIGHARLIDEVDDAVDEIGLEVTRKRYDLADKNQQMFATYDIGGFDQHHIPGEVRFQIGFRGSINQTLAELIAFGTSVLVCSNGMIAGEKLIGHKNTTSILDVLPGRIREALQHFEVFRDIQTRQYERLADTRLNDRQAHDFICRTARLKDEVITKGEFVSVLNQWHEPTCDWGSKTAWRLQNAFTDTTKRVMERNPVVGSVRTMRLNSLFHKTFAHDVPTLTDASNN